MFASMAPAMGMAVRLTTSKGETLATPETATITAVIGETLRAMLEANCMGNSMATGAIDIFVAMAGASAAKANNRGERADMARLSAGERAATIAKISVYHHRHKGLSRLIVQKT